ncbi:MAG TPA: hypothetical protein DCL38_03050 [Lachnospiraceae bacterium]|nr:hypothetical protein [Lachnospiraceae bacterium]
MRRDRLQNLEDLFFQEIKDGRLKGCSIMVLHNGNTEFRGEYGSDKRDTIYRIFSMTKPVTAVAILILMERGLLDLLDPLSGYIPEFKDMKIVTAEGEVSAKNEITIADCLNMTSGMVYPGEDSVSAIRLSKEAERIAVRQEFGEKIDAVTVARAVAGVPLLFEPGTRWNYSVSADVLAGVAEVITGMPFGEFLRRAVFAPLDMQDTMYVSELGEKEERLAPLYSRNKDGEIVPMSRQQMDALSAGAFSSVRATSFYGGGSGLCSTLSDYSKFALMLLNDGEYNGIRILGRKTAQFMHTDGLSEEVRKTISFKNIKGYSYSNLLRIMKDTGEAGSNGSNGEFGWDGMLGTYFLADPLERLVFVYGQQILGGLDESLMRRIRSIIYSALE